jgi:hypothetical protein
MLRIWILAVGLCSCLTLTATADDEEDKKPEGARRRGQLTEEQRAVQKEIRAKYDKNKDGKLDAEERKAITAEDKEKLAKAGLTPRKRREAPTTPTTPTTK